MTFIRSLFLFLILVSKCIPSQELTVSPSAAFLGEFPSWEGAQMAFSMKNEMAHPVRLLRVRSSCSCAIADFQLCTLAPGQATTVAVRIPPNTLSGKFTRMVYVETDAPDQEFVPLTLSGTALPAVAVQPKGEVYLGRLVAGKIQNYSFLLRVAHPDISLELLPSEAGEGEAEATLVRRNDTTYAMELSFTPDASRRYVAIRRRIAIEWNHDLPPLRLAILFSVETDASQ